MYIQSKCSALLPRERLGRFLGLASKSGRSRIAPESRPASAPGLIVSQPVGSRLFRKAGGMPPAMLDLRASLSPGRHLSLPEREEIALLKVQGRSIRKSGAAWGGMLRRSPVNCGGTWQSAAASWSIGQQLPNGVQTDLPAGPSPTKLAINEPCALMWSGDLPAAL